MLKTYDELRKFDVSPYVEQRDGADYLNWAKCIDLLHKNGAEKVYFEPCVNEKGSSLFMSDQEFTDKNGVKNRCYEVRVKVTIDDLEFESQFPVMNGGNPVKDNSMSQQRIWNAQARAFVKGVAIHTGLGFGLWLKDAEGRIKEDDLSSHDIIKIQKRVQMLISQKMREKDASREEIAKMLGMKEKQISFLLGDYDKLDRFERAINEL